MKRRRVWLWFLAALLPVALYAIIAERNSWRPRRFSFGPFAQKQLLAAQWMADSRRLQLVVQNAVGDIALETWDARHERLLRARFLDNSNDLRTKWLFSTDRQGLVESSYDNGPCRLRFMRQRAFHALKNAEPVAFGDHLLLTAQQEASDETYSINLTTWDVRTEKKLATARLRPVHGYAPTPEMMDFTLDGRRGAVALLKEATARSPATEFRLLIFDPRTGKHVRTLNVDNNGVGVRRLQFSPDGRRLALTIIRERTFMRLWDVTSKRRGPRLELHSHTGVSSFSPDGKRLATSYYGDEGIRLWDTRTGQLQRLIPGATKGYARLDFSPDGRTLAAFDGNNTVTLWRLF